MSEDVKIFNACNHIVNNKKYDIANCPRCWGKGYYYDISFDEQGETIVCNSEIKLQQEVLKIMNDAQFSNIFHQFWGDPLVNHDFSRKNTKLIQQKISHVIYETLMYLKNIQNNEQILYKQLSPKEIIDSIDNISVQQINSVNILVVISFTNLQGTIYTQQIII